MALTERYILCKTTHLKIKRRKTTNFRWSWLLRHTTCVPYVSHLKTRNANIQKNFRWLHIKRPTKTMIFLNQENIFSPFSLTASWSFNEMSTKETPARNKTSTARILELPYRIVMIMCFWWLLSRNDIRHEHSNVKKRIRKPWRQSYYNCTGYS